eukprot:6397-Prorocentrum_minimum.AAC.1
MVSELTVLIRSGSDDTAMACACLIALAADDVSRRQLLHVPQTQGMVMHLINEVGCYTYVTPGGGVTLRE